MLTAIGNALTLLGALLFQMFGRKGATVTAIIFAFIAATLVFVVCMREFILLLITYVVMPAWLAPLAWFVPLNFTFVCSTLLAARSCRAAYDYAVSKYRLINSAN